MAIFDRAPRFPTLRGGLARPILAYLAVVTATAALGFNLGLIVLAGVLLIPAMVGTIATVHRLEAKTRVARRSWAPSRGLAGASSSRSRSPS
jgi:hypothetical protein